MAVTAIALVLTGVLSWVAFVINDHNEDRLLRLKVAETGAVLQASLPSIDTPLASAAEIARPDNGGLAGFRRYMADYVGAKRTFVVAQLWTDPAAAPVATIGRSTQLPGNAAAVRSFVTHTATRPGLSVQAFVSGPNRVLGYTYASPGAPNGPFIYAESPLPPDPQVPPTTDTPFSDLRFALYLGRHPAPDMLLETNTGSLGTRTAKTVVPFGDTALLVVGAPDGSLGGTLSASLWWIVAAAGCVLSLVAGAMTERLLRRRHAAEALAADVQRLLDRQQTISSVLQRAMIPPTPTGPAYLEVGSRYLPGGDELELGGDWFDVIELDADRTLLSIGDVAGRGLTAGTVMASLRSAIRAFVSEGHDPGNILGRLGSMLATNGERRFATVEFLVLDRRALRVTAAAAGHLPPLVICRDGARYLDLPVGPPIGAMPEPVVYREQTFDLAAGATLLLFTDGLIERRDESIDDGLARLRDAAARATGTVDEVLDQIITELHADGTDDDTAILGVRLS